MLKTFDLVASNTPQQSLQIRTNMTETSLNNNNNCSNVNNSNSTSSNCGSTPMITSSTTNAAIAVVAPTTRSTQSTSSSASSSSSSSSMSLTNMVNSTSNTTANGTNTSSGNGIGAGGGGNVGSLVNTKNGSISGGGGGGVVLGLNTATTTNKNTIQPPPPPPQQQQQQQIKVQNNILHVAAAPRHIYHQHYHQLHGGTAAMQPPPPPPPVSQWPSVEPVFHFGPGFEHQHYCPTHSQGPQPHEHIVFFHVNPGVSVTFQIAGNREIIRGPVTVPMVSQSGSPPIAMPVQVPPGHIMQQIVDENGTLRHVILSTAQHQQIHGQNVQSPLQGHYISTNNNGPHYFNPIPASLAGPGATQFFHPIPNSHGPPTNAVPPPSTILHSAAAVTSSLSPGNNFHKDERTQRQHTKLLKKLDQKQKDINSSPILSLSPRKADINGINRGILSHESCDEIDDSSSSIQDQDDNEVVSIVELLSSVQSPIISEITPRSALLQWFAPIVTDNVSLNVNELRYEVLLSDRGKEGKYKIIFKGASMSCRIRDLRPGQEYSVCLQVYLGENKGSASEAAIFTTPACEPDAPLPPKLIARTKNSLQLRWNASVDNGAHIQHYILEYDEGKGKEFIELIKMKGKQYSLSKLQPSTWYSFRLASVNECGRSAYSDIITYSTAGHPPVQLAPPILQLATANSLCVAWTHRTDDEEFVLQISDCQSGHGFLTAYTGRATMYECMKLKRASIYQFRIRGENEAGVSVWSDTIAYETLLEKPSSPLKLQVKGKILSHRFKVKWETPSDNGGTDMITYRLDISSGKVFENIYNGSDMEATCDRLTPVTTYQIKVACENAAGLGPYSDVCSVTTDAVAPSTPMPPFLGSAPSAFAAFIQWNPVSYDGGAIVTDYELKLGANCVYKGKDLYFVVKNLFPGESYTIQIRAVNRIGWSGWSDALEFNASATAPFAPIQPEIIVHSSNSMTIRWEKPMTNGAPIKEYILVRSQTEQFPSDEEGDSKIFSRNVCYRGVTNVAELSNLIPFTDYYFKVCAVNSAGESQFSPVAYAQTLKAGPGTPTILSYKTKPNEITIIWSEPVDNGAFILNYNVECDNRLMATDGAVLELTINDLEPKTKYGCRLQAVNEIGAGQFSAIYYITTMSLPPKPPKIDCTYCGYKTIVLKWGDKPNSEYIFSVQMYSKNSREYKNIYMGSNCTMKLFKLQEQTAYSFRICSRDNTSEFGAYSDEYTFKTRAAPPKSIKEPDVIESERTLLLEWQQSKNSFSDTTVEYILQMAMNKKEFKQVYRGLETQYTIDKLPHVHNYMFRVCPVRLTMGEEIKGTFSPALRYKLESIIENHIVSDEQQLYNNDCRDAYASRNLINKYLATLYLNYSSRKRMTDKEKAIIFSIFFVVLTIGFSSIIKHFIS